MLLPLVLAILILCHNAELVRVKVQEGWLEGALVEMSTGLGQYYSFKGIPYAEPPVGSLRFKDPVPFKSWKGVRNATSHGSVCPQFDIFAFTYVISTEDCLFLNVYTPSLTPKKRLPVLIYIHGGGYMSGSGNDAEYGPDFLVHHDIVVVTLNYRLDALGFLNLNTKEVPGNAGLKDQALAMKWVKRNIKHFGGDPNQITIMGQSAGGASVAHHIISPMTKGLFKRAIVMSGVPLCDWAFPFEQERRAFALGRNLGNDTKDPGVLLEFLQSLPAIDLLNSRPFLLTQESIWSQGLKIYQFVPSPELDFGQKRFIEEPVIQSLKKGNIKDLDLLIGYTSNEYMFEIPLLEYGLLAFANTYKELLVPREILLELPPKEVLEFSKSVHQQYFNSSPITNDTIENYLKFDNDHIFVYSINRFLKHLPLGRAKKYLYKFFTVSNRNLANVFGYKYNISGVAHLDDLRYLFDAKKYSEPIDVNSREYQQNPTPDDFLGAIWPEYTLDEKAYMAINDTLTPGTHLDADIVDFWARIYKEGGVELP